jgi:hypothetical protein
MSYEQQAVDYAIANPVTAKTQDGIFVHHGARSKRETLQYSRTTIGMELYPHCLFFIAACFMFS